MLRNKTLVCLICSLAMVFMGVVPSVFAMVAEGPATYGNEPYAWIEAGSYETEEKVLFDEATFDWTWGPSPVVGSAYSLADIRQGESGTTKARSTIYYHDPYGSESLSIAAAAETWKPFVVASDTLPAGTPVNVTLSISYTGTLQALESVPDKYAYASAEGSMKLFDNTSALLASRSGEAEVECELIGDQWEFITEAIGAWEGLLTEKTDLNNHPIYELAYTEDIVFNAIIGETYWLWFDLGTRANSSAGSNLGWENSQTFAEADFSNTGSYLLSSPADVRFVIVPEPLTIGMLMLAGLAVLRRCRRA